MLKSFFEYVFENIDSKYVTIYFSKRLQNFLYDIEKSSTDPQIVRLANSIRMADGSNQIPPFEFTPAKEPGPPGP